MASCSGETASSKPKTSLLSLPDEVLQDIVHLVAGEIYFADNSCTRDGINNGDLPELRLVNRRLSRIVQAELYRTPNALTDHQGPFSGDDLDILLNQEIARSAQMLSLAGTSRFFAGILEASGFCRLTSLILVFGDLENPSKPGILRSKSLMRLRDALQALPLRELHIHFAHDQILSSYKFYQIAQLGAGHATLRKFSVLGEHDPGLERGSARLESLIQPTGYTSSIVSLALDKVAPEHAQIVRAALGALPCLADVALNTLANDASDETVAATLASLTSHSTHSILRVRLFVEELGPRTWQSLACLPHLDALDINSIRESDEGPLPDVALPKLSRIVIRKWFLFSTREYLYEKILNRQLLPSLQDIELKYVKASAFFPSHPALFQEVIAANDELVKARPNIRICPHTVREDIVRLLRASGLRN